MWTYTNKALILIYFIETLLDLETYSAIDVILNSLWIDVWIINCQHIFKETLKETAKKKVMYR